MNEEVAGGDGGRLWTRFIWTIQSPRTLFTDISGGAPWWQPWVWVSLINMAIGYVSMPIQIHLMRLNPGNMSADQVQQTTEAMEKWGLLGVISTPVVVLLTSLAIAGISYLLVSMLSEEPRFKKYFTLYLYASIVSSMGLLLGTVITRMKGIENIRSFDDAVASFGPEMLLDGDSKILHAVLSNFDVFQIWFYVLLGMGLMHVFNMTKRTALFVIIPVWLLFVLLSLVSKRVSGV